MNNNFDNIIRGLKGIVSYLSDDGVFGTILVDGIEYAFHSSSLSSPVNVGDEVEFDAIFDNQVLFAFKVRKCEELTQPFSRTK